MNGRIEPLLVIFDILLFPRKFRADLRGNPVAGGGSNIDEG